ncbi:MAG: L,D-transpeptidase [Spirulinaceae cyanobacterium]
MSDDSFPSVEQTLGACLALTGLTLTFAVDGSVPETQQASVNSNKLLPKVSLNNDGQRWLEIDLSDQRLFAWEGNTQVHAVIVSTGKSSTPTPTGKFTIGQKLPQQRMQGAGYSLPNVPHVMYYSGNYAIHGTYWHNNFGIPVSHGCINLAPDQASWFYDWAALGTPVVIHE